MLKKSFISTLIVILASMVLGVTAFAHEIFYSGTAPNGTPIVLKWKWKNTANTKIELKCSEDYLGSIWTPKYSTAMTRWNVECGNDVYLHDNSYSGSKVDFAMPTETNWVSMVGNYNAYFGGAVGLAKIQDEAGTWITSVALANNSASKRIKYAQIYMTPIASVYNSMDSIEKSIALVHELGHVMCLGHSNTEFYPTTADSIMESLIDTISSDSPTTHDRNDISSKY